MNALRHGRDGVPDLLKTGSGGLGCVESRLGLLIADKTEAVSDFEAAPLADVLVPYVVGEGGHHGLLSI